MSDEPTEQDAVAALLEAHEHGHKVVNAAMNVLQSARDEEAIAGVAAAFHRFVTFESPLHELDEEELIFPALRVYAPEKEVDSALTYVIDEHVDFDALRERLALRWGHVMETPAGLGSLRAELLPLTEQFAHMLVRHAEHEELVIFPLVEKYVPPEVQAKIVGVMRVRAKR